MVEGDKKDGGVYLSQDYGASWHKHSDYQTSGNYYVELFVDPKDENKVFSMDTWLQHSEDGGKTFNKTGEKDKHVDNHAIWIDPADSDHWIIGCDGGIYETWTHAQHWQFKANLPITQFYKLAVGQDTPFYHIYGGTQDNNTIGGPSRTVNNAGITNGDWYITKGGDGFKSQVDPKDPNIVYSQSQYGWLVRYNKTTSEQVNIKPMPEPNETLKWNWDSPLLISPHNHKRLYFGSNKLFMSDDQGNNWEKISPDLTRKIDRNQLPVMGKVWGPDAIAKNRSTSNYGNLTSLTESPLQPGHLAVGSDDGLIHISNDMGENWRNINELPGVPENTYVASLSYSKHHENRLYAVLNNHKMGDFKPYLLKTEDNGKTWQDLTESLPKNGPLYALVEDHEDEDLLFLGSEFGVHFTANRGKNWHPLKTNLPTIAVRDMAIQEKANDLVLATFGRGFYILDDYSILRHTQKLGKDSAFVFTGNSGLLYIESSPLGTRNKASQGASYFTTPNPKPGMYLYYFAPSKPKTLRSKRQKTEASSIEYGKDKGYPSLAELTAESMDQEAMLLFEIRNQEGDIIARKKEEWKEGLQQFHWDGRYTTKSPVQLKEKAISRYASRDWGILVPAGKYEVRMYSLDDHDVKALTPWTPFDLIDLYPKTTKELSETRKVFYKSSNQLMRSLQGARKLLTEKKEQLDYIEKAILQTPNIPLHFVNKLRDLRIVQDDLNTRLTGNKVARERYYAQPISLMDRAYYAHGSMINNTEEPTGTALRLYKEAEQEYDVEWHPMFKRWVQSIEYLVTELDQYGLPYTKGRNSEWKEQ